MQISFSLESFYFHFKEQLVCSGNANLINNFTIRWQFLSVCLYKVWSLKMTFWHCRASISQFFVDPREHASSFSHWRTKSTCNSLPTFGRDSLSQMSNFFWTFIKRRRIVNEMITNIFQKLIYCRPYNFFDPN